MFEVQDLKFATLATVSRCGMVWFSEDVLSPEMIYENYLQTLKNVSLEEGEEETPKTLGGENEETLSKTIQVYIHVDHCYLKGRIYMYIGTFLLHFWLQVYNFYCTFDFIGFVMCINIWCRWEKKTHYWQVFCGTV